MDNNQSTWMKEHSLLLYVVLACGFSWMIEIPLALRSQGLIQVSLPAALHYLAAYGPMLAALIMTELTEGRAGLRDLFGRLLKWRVKPLWWVVATSPLLLMLLINGARWMLPGTMADFRMLGDVDFLPYVGIGALPLWILTFGIGEETGWRGYLLPRLQGKRSALAATLILWLLWSFWHLPLFFYAYDVSVLPGLLIGLLAASVTFTWLYNSTRGSVLICAVWHGLFNVTTACTACKTGLMAAAISTVVMVWSVVIVALFKPTDLSTFRERIARGVALHSQ